MLQSLSFLLLLCNVLVLEYTKKTQYYYYDGNTWAMELQLVNDSVFVQYDINQTLSYEMGDVIIGKYEIKGDTLFLTEKNWEYDLNSEKDFENGRNIIECYHYSKRKLTKSCFSRYDSLFIDKPDYEILTLKKGKSKKLREWQAEYPISWSALTRENEPSCRIPNFIPLK